MKLKYYLRGMGIGIILTAIVMGFALGGRKAALSDAEVIKRAKALGMIESSAEVLTETQIEDSEVESDDTSTSNQTLDQIGEKIPEEVNTELALSDPAVPEVVTQTQETTSDISESDSSAEASTEEKQESTAEATTAESKAEASTEEVTETAPETPASTNKNTETESAAATDSTTTLNSTSKVVTIPGGTGSDGVAAILAREGIIDDAVAFNKYLVERRIDRIIRSGTKTIPANATYEEIAKIITTG